jgi:prepilin-type processing-associated H-X9-DG protein
MVLVFYANRNDAGQYPALSNRPGILAMNAESICPEYLTDLKLLQCPAQRKLKKWYQMEPTPPESCDDDQSYFYLGYSIPDQATLEQFALAYRATLDAQQTFEIDLHLKVDGEKEVVLPRLPGNSLSFDGGTFTSDVPVFIERVPNGHQPKGGHVAYADGHVEFIKWGEKWPMTQEAMDVLLALDALANE